MSPKSKILEYTVYFEPLAESGYGAFFPDFPEIVTYGRTLIEVRRMAKDALRCHLEGLLKEKKDFFSLFSTAKFLPRREKIGLTLNPA